jgi:long-chain acyl-CoA synthetase
MSVVDFLLQSAAESPETIALEPAGGEPVSLGQLALLTRSLAAGLRKLGLRRGEGVGIMLPNVPYFPIAAYGAWMNGCVVVPFNVMLTPRELRYQFEDSLIRLLFTSEALLPTVEKALGEMTQPPVVVVIDGGRHLFIGDLLDNPDGVSPEPVANDEHVLTQYTAGTQGRPKGVMLTAGNLEAQVDMIVDTLPVTRGERVLCVLPLFHSFALNGLLHSALRCGVTVVMHPRFELESCIRSLAQDNIHLFAGVPTMYKYLLHHPEAEQLTFPSLRYCITASSAMPLKVMEEFERRFGVPIFDSYGLTETTVGASGNRPGAGGRKLGSVGLPYKGVEIKAVDKGGDDLPVGQLGELAIRGPQVMLGYLNMPESTAEVLVEGWFYSGDIGYVDEDGFVYITDRKKDMIIKGGYNVSPREIEEVIYRLPDIAEASVVGMHCDVKGELIYAAVVVKPGRFLAEETLREHLRTHLARYKQPERYLFLDDLPKGANGKILKRKLREMYAIASNPETNNETTI